MKLKKVEELATIIDKVIEKCICHHECCDNCEMYDEMNGMCLLSIIIANEIIKSRYKK